MSDEYSRNLSLDEVTDALMEAFARSGTRHSRDTVIYKNFKDILSARDIQCERTEVCSEVKSDDLNFGEGRKSNQP